MDLRSKRHTLGTTSEMDEVPFSVELMVGANHPFYRILLEAIDDAESAANKKRTANS